MLVNVDINPICRSSAKASSVVEPANVQFVSKTVNLTVIRLASEENPVVTVPLREQTTEWTVGESNWMQHFGGEEVMLAKLRERDL